jgi:hypothetical protein
MKTMRGLACAACRAPNRSHLDALLVAGKKSMKAMAVETGVPYDAIRRHAANGHVTGLSKGASSSPSSAPLPAGATPFEVMRKRVDDLAAMDTSTMSNRDRIQHSEELRRAAETLARLSPVDPTTQVITVADVMGLNELMGELLILRDRPSIDTTDPDAARWMAVGWINAINEVMAAVSRAMEHATELVEEAS